MTMADQRKRPHVMLWAVIALGVAAIVIMAGPHAWRYVRNKTLLSTGTEAPAQVLEVIDTGSRFNASPLVRVKLEVRPTEGEPFPAEAVMVLSAVDLQKVQPGVVVTVRYDPGDPSRVAIVRD